MKRSLCVLLGLLALFVLSSASGKSVDASMIVTGTIVVNPDGTVQGYSLDEQDKLPPSVVGLVSRTVARWKFKPVMADGKPALAESWWCRSFSMRGVPTACNMANGWRTSLARLRLFPGHGTISVSRPTEALTPFRMALYSKATHVSCC